MEAGEKDDSSKMEVMKRRTRKSARTVVMRPALPALADNLRKELLTKGSRKVEWKIPILKLRRVGDKSGGQADNIGKKLKPICTSSLDQNPIDSHQSTVSCVPVSSDNGSSCQNSTGAISYLQLNDNPSAIDEETLIKFSQVPLKSDSDSGPFAPPTSISINTFKDESPSAPSAVPTEEYVRKPATDRFNTADKNSYFLTMPIIVTEDELLESGYQPELENAVGTSYISQICLTCGTLLTEDSTCPLCEKQRDVGHDIKIYSGPSSPSSISLTASLSTSRDGPRLVSTQALSNNEELKKPQKRALSTRAPRPLKKKTRFQCPICPKSFAGKHNLKYHHSKEHARDPPSIQCSFCEIRFHKTDTYRVHQLRKHAFQTLQDTLPLGTTERELEEAMEVISQKILRIPEDKIAGCYCPYCAHRRRRVSEIKDHILSGHLPEVINVLQRKDVHYLKQTPENS